MLTDRQSLWTDRQLLIRIMMKVYDFMIHKVTLVYKNARFPNL